MPIDIVYGFVNRNDNLPINAPLGECTCEYTLSLQERLRYAYGKAHQTLQAYSERMKVYYDTGLVERKFKPGDWVIRYYKPATAQTLGVPARGPYVVERQCSPEVYEIRESPEAVPSTVHVNHLRPCRAKTGVPNWVTERLTDPPDIADGGGISLPNPHHRSAAVQTVGSVRTESRATQYDLKSLPTRVSTRERHKPARYGDELANSSEIPTPEEPHS